jgi:hypothetical protein
MKKKLLPYLLIILSTTQGYCSEFQINNRTSLSQANSDIAALPNGGFAVVWSSYFNSIDRSNDILGRIFEPNCDPKNLEFQINQTTPGNQTEPSIAAKKSGECIVLWHGPGASEQDGDDIFAQRIDVNGLPIGQEFRVNNTTFKNDQSCTKIAFNESGSMTIVWESETEPNTTIICCRRFDSNCIALEDEFKVSISPNGRYPDIAMDPNGNFTIVWLEGKSQNFSIMARVYDSNCASITEPFKVNKVNVTSLGQPAIAMDASGCFLITWDGDPNLASNDDIYARLYAPNGTPKGEQFIVNSTMEKAQQNPQVAINDEGQYLIVWDSDGDPNSNQKDIFGQRLSSSGERIGNEFRINTYTDSNQKCPAVAFLDNGRFVTVWQSQDQDGSSYGIYGESGEFIAAADLNWDGYIDFYDFNLLATEWHSSKPLVSDLIEDDKVDGHDLLAFCQRWLKPFNK